MGGGRRWVGGGWGRGRAGGARRHADHTESRPRPGPTRPRDPPGHGLLVRPGPARPGFQAGDGDGDGGTGTGGLGGVEGERGPRPPQPQPRQHLCLSPTESNTHHRDHPSDSFRRNPSFRVRPSDSVGPSVRLTVTPSRVRPSVRPSVTVRPSVRVRQSVRPSHRPSVRPSVCLSIRPSVRPSVTGVTVRPSVDSVRPSVGLCPSLHPVAARRPHATYQRLSVTVGAKSGLCERGVQPC